MIRRVKFVSIPVKNQNTALEFYTKKLGFKILTDQPFNDTQRWIELEIPGAETKVVLFTPEGHEDRVGGFLNLTFESDDIETTYRIVQEKGVKIEEKLSKEHWGSMFVMKDSEGNSICVSEKR